MSPHDVALARTAVPAAVLAAGTAVGNAALHSSLHDGHALGAVWVRIALLTVPLAVAAVVLGARLADRVSVWAQARGSTAAATRTFLRAALLAALLVPVAAIQLLRVAATSTTTSSSGTHSGHAGEGIVGAAADSPGVVLLLGQVAIHTLVAFLLALALLTALEWLQAGLLAAWQVARTPRLHRAAIGLVAGSAVLVSPLAVPANAASSAAAAAPAEHAACDAGSANRSYDVAAINVHLVYNRWGQGNPDAQIYVLQHDKLAVRDWHEPLDSTSSNRRLRPRPLVLRANEGECVAVTFTNELDVQQGEGLPTNPRASMYVRGIPFDVQSSGGSHVGYNDDTTVGIGETVTYYWTAHREGIYFFNDSATTAGSEADGGSLAGGLYGAFVVEPPNSTWTDPVSGDPLYSGTLDQSGELYISAIIDPQDGKPFREFIQLAQDELPVTSTMAFNYGSEDTEVRAEHGCPDCVGEETSLSSWVYGDPALVKLASGFGPWLPDTPAGEENCGLGTDGFEADSCFTANVSPAYKGDATKIRYGMAGVKETHVFHLHAHTWLAEDKDTGAAGDTPPRPTADLKGESSTIDSQTFGPMEMFTADLIYGAGSKNGTVGDSIFHCHLYPHFVAGFWGLLRVLDVRERGAGETPDGLKVWAVQPLPGRPSPGDPTADNPGFPRFIPGEFGWRAPQPPLGITEPDGTDAPRYVAGQELQDASPEVQLEQQVINRLGGSSPERGAPFGDPCPSGSREVTYKVSVIQTPITYNERGDFDSQGRILVLDKHVDDILSGRRQPEPLFARVNQGDCINWQLTNRAPNWFGDDAFVQLQQTNMFGQHIHLVKFDVLASDGSSNGWNYQQAAFTSEQARFNADIAANPGTCTQASCKLPTPATYDFSQGSKGLAPGQTIHERWYADYELRTVFTHDHHFAALDQNRGQYGAVVVEPKGMDFRNPVTGTWYQPVNSPAHGTVCASSCEGDAAGANMDVIGPGPDDDFREFGLAVADFVSLTRGGGDPRNPADAINPPGAPETFPDDDPGVMSVNYRNAPLELRREKNGKAVDPAYMFSSHVFGDPMTPVLQAYSGDNVRVRLIQGAQEEQHTMMIHGVKWRREPDDPGSHFVNALPVGVSEAFNFEAPRLGCPSGQDCRGDYLYTSASIDDMWTGMWGLMRVNGGRVPNLLPLPDNPVGAAGSVPRKSETALAPPARTTAGDPCPTGAPKRTFDVVAMQTTLVYNEAGDNDPFGLVYALAEDEQAIRDGMQPEPLVIRANQGDCVEVTLTNKLTPDLQEHTGEGDAHLPGRSPENRWVPGLRVSMHTSLLQYDVRGSDGAAIGFNRDQTVAPGKSMMYRWYADTVTKSELGGSALSDYGDVIGHRHHGLFGSVIVEPKNATWHDPATGEPLQSGTQADVRVPGQKDFRESVVFFQDGLNLRNEDGTIIEDPLDHPPTPEEPEGEALDAEDSGEKGFNYKSEPFRNRLGYEPVSTAGPGTDLAEIYDSHKHGDPSTPIMRAYEGDELKVRVIMANDKPRQHSFGLAGHGYPASPDDPHTRHIGTRSGLGPGMAVNADMGQTNQPGDYLYGCDVGLFHRSGGLWGMLRVYPQPASGVALKPTRIGEVDDPRQGGHPLLPLELDQLEVSVFEDVDGDGARGKMEPLLPGATVALTGAGREAVGGEDGTAYLSVRQGNHQLTVSAPGRPDLAPVSTTVQTTGNNDWRTVSVGLAEAAPTGKGRVRVVAFDDRDADGRLDVGEARIDGLGASLKQAGTEVAAAATADGAPAALDALPGTYDLEVTAPRGYRVASQQRQVVLREGVSSWSYVALASARVAKSTVRVRAFLDRDADRRRDRGERGLKGVYVAAYRGGSLVGANRTNRRGMAVLRLPAKGRYVVELSAPRKFRATPGRIRLRGLKPGKRITRSVAVRRR